MIIVTITIGSLMIGFTVATLAAVNYYDKLLMKY